MAYTVLAYLSLSPCTHRFLQKARKEVLTRRYDPHGKMRRLGLSMDPPPPPDFCRLEATVATPLAAHLSPTHYGEDNMAYCVSRSPSTDQQNQQQQQQQQQHPHGGTQPARRSLYHTYHDSGISAGGLAAALADSIQQMGGDGEVGRSEARVGAPGGLAYRTCPDSGVSGLSGGFYMPGDTTGLGGMCPGPSCQLHDHQHQQMFYEDQYHQQQPRPPVYHHQQQEQQLRPQHLHHTLVQASVHPTHGVCYGDDTNHPQSPQHYAPPPHHPQQQQHYNYNHAHHQQQQHSESRAGHLQHMQMAAQIHYPPPSSSLTHKDGPGLASPRRCRGADDDQVFELVSPTHPKDAHHGQDFTTETSFGPQGAMDVMVTASSDPRIANISLPAQQSIVLSCLVQQQQQQQHGQLQQLQHSDSPSVHHTLHLQQQQQQKLHNLASTATPATLKSSLGSNSPSSHPNHHRDSGIAEDAGGSSGSHSSTSTSGSADQSSNNNTITSSTSSSERPDSQASHSPSTTDSEDSGFRGSHGPNSAPTVPAAAPTPASRLNKQTNPLLKPMRRPRNKASRKGPAGQSSTSPPRAAKRQPSAPAQREPSTIANTDSSNPGSPTPLITLDPQNLSPPALSDNSSVLGRGLEMIDMAGRGGPASLRTPDSSPHHSPSDWPSEPGSRKGSKDGGVALGDISTHLSWSYLQGLSSGQVTGGVGSNSAHARTAGSVSGPEGGASQLRQDMRHMDVLGYSVV